MPNWLRILLLVFAVCVLGLVIAGVLAFRWMRSHGSEFAERSKAIVADGRRFGEGKQANDCIEEGLRRVKASTGFMETVSARVFTSECLRSSTVPADFCSTVPTGILDSAKWANEQCSKRAMPSDQGCLGIFQEATTICRTGSAKTGR